MPPPPALLLINVLFGISFSIFWFGGFSMGQIWSFFKGLTLLAGFTAAALAFNGDQRYKVEATLYSFFEMIIGTISCLMMIGAPGRLLLQALSLI